MREETKEFIKNWEIMLSQITEADGKLKELYEKFRTLYTIYNRYYNEAFYLLQLDNKLEKPRYTDYEKATIIVISFLGADVISERMSEKDNQQQLDAVCKVIPKFNINLIDGNPSKETDKKLLENLKSADPGVKAKAVLSLIHNVRCNIVHGYKDFQEYQRLLVEPLITLLQAVIDIFKQKIG